MPPNYDTTTTSSTDNNSTTMFSNKKTEMAPPSPHNTAMPPTTGPPASSPANTQFKIDPNLVQSQVIKVAIRLRPLQDPAANDENNNSSSNKRSKSSDVKKAWSLQKSGATDSFVQNGVVRKVEGRSVFHFDQIFEEDTKTPLLYKSLARPMVKTVISGRHGTIFAYGNTGTGKTFTMQGDGKAASGQAGIIQLVASDLFRFMRQGPAMKRDFTVKVSYIEIYNEKIRDLLCESNANSGSSPMSASSSSAPEITIRTTANGDIAVNCTQKEVENVDQVLELLIAGNQRRIVAETNRNMHSSRSHAIFRLNVESRSKGMTSVVTAPDASGELVRVSDFNLVDLAGSESLKHSGNNTVRQKEGININQSLMSLSGVIHSLSLPPKKRPKHINYRDSKLTRILQPHLSGNAEMAIICCASAAKACLEETRSTLRFAHRAKLVEMKPKINEIVDDGALIKKLQAELAEAKKALEEMKGQRQQYQQRPSASSFSDHPHSNHSQPDYGYGDPDMMDNNNINNNNDDGNDDDEFTTPAARRYIMPKGHQLDGSSNHSRQQQPQHQSQPPKSPLRPPMARLGSIGAGGPSRPYVMPQDQAIPQDSTFQQFVNRPSDNSPQNSSNQFQLDNINPNGGNAMGVFRNNNSNNGMMFQKSASDEADISAIANISSSFEGGLLTPPKKALNSLDFPIPHRSMDRTGTTAEMEDDSFMVGGSGGGGRMGIGGVISDDDDDGMEASYAQVSIKYGNSVVSAPESFVMDDDDNRTHRQQQASKAGRTTESGHFALSEPGGANTISWDTVKIDAPTKAQVGTPLQALKSLDNDEAPIPTEITIITDSLVLGKVDACLTDQLADALMRSTFLERKVEAADDLVEALFKDLERARLCIHDLVHRNVTLATRVKEARREDTKEQYQASEIVLEQYWLLKGSMYASLFFFFTGGYELFTATVILIWLIMESTVVKPQLLEGR
eukprot:CAMPEP_0119545576 /NCGR_PEP_ID=MMETSP1352-20130426/282_1 /TAXON_ID=265584 /ORGANISM="Stauroneis constricta, Strain CCMP1120" /LENGTH=960 /DNA_ID=CAMNT_0007590135 /DNA_START=710 /DNA_END=3595 /DNA_ORIENTATION=-